MVDDERRGGLADAAQVAIAGQDPFPAPAEAGQERWPRLYQDSHSPQR